MKLRNAATFVCILMMFAGCAGEPDAPVSSPTPLALAKPSAVPSPTPDPTPTLSPANTPTPPPLDASGVFDKVSPSVAFIETDRGSGSGILLEDGYVLTNAHVIWPFTEARVVFPDGSEFIDTPVLASDLVGDLAVLGPIETSIAPAVFLKDERLLVGKDVYLIGYPGEVDKFPQPTISRGLVSRLRSWPAIDMTYLQTDATIAGGQSGGVLVSDRGEVAGISGNSFPDTSFALVASADDVLKRVAGLVAGEDVDGLGRRPELDDASADVQHMLVIDSRGAGQTFALHGVKGDKIEIEADANNNLALWVIDPRSEYVAFADNTESGAELVEFEVAQDGVHIVEVYEVNGAPSIGWVNSTVQLIPLMDRDDNRRPVTGGAISGNLDYIDDVDSYRMFLKRGQEINIGVESVMIDPLVSVDMDAIFDDDPELPYDDDSGKGLFGTDAGMSYRAPDDGIYYLIVQSAPGYESGGYLLKVDEVEANDPTPMAPKPTPTPIRSSLGQMTRFESKGIPKFQIDHPAEWSAITPSSPLAVLCDLVEYCRSADSDQLVFLITEEHLGELNLGNMTLEEYATLTKQVLEARAASMQMIRSEEITNDRGIPLYVLEYESSVPSLHYIILLNISRGTAFKATFIFPAVPPGATDELTQAIERKQRQLGEKIEVMIDSFWVQD